MSDDYLQHLAAQDPELARLLAEQDQRLGDPVEQWHTRFDGKKDQSEEARIRAVVIPLIARAAVWTRREVLREVRSLKRRARLRRWSRADIDRYVTSKPRVQPDE
jgi:hypothetical protein